jgi:single-strand DNA-binding protein
MASFNRVILMGNLTRDPEVRQTQTGTTIAKTGLAVNERMPDGQGGWKEETSFIDVVIFGKRAEAFGKFLQKGKPVLVEGRLRQDRWQDKESGANRSRVEVVIDNWEFVGGRGDGRPDERSGPAPERAASAPGFPGASDFGGGGGGFADDVPV